MLCENLVETQNELLGLSVTVRLMNLDAPRSEEELKSELLAHALDCHECLTVVLFQEDSLAECGCEVYREMFEAATEELKRQAPVDPVAHLTDDLIQSFFWDQLSEDQMMGMAEHLEGCADCRDALKRRQDFHLGTKALIESQREARASDSGLRGTMSLVAPGCEQQFNSFNPSH